MSKARDLSNLINTLEGVMPQGKRTDFDGVYIYKGFALPGSLDTEAVWQIQRIEKVVGGDGVTDYRYTNANVVNNVASTTVIWNDRAAQVYT